MGWQVEFTRAAEKDLRKLDPQVARRILRFLHERVEVQDNPRHIGSALQGSELGEFWRYRVGDYRVIALIQDQCVTVQVVRVGGRGEVYR